MSQSLQRQVRTNQLYAEVCFGLADSTRILILYKLAEGPHNVTNLARALDIPQPSVSRHLKILRQRNMVLSERQGTAVVYRLGDKRLIQALDLLGEFLHDSLSHRVALIEHWSERDQVRGE